MNSKKFNSQLFFDIIQTPRIHHVMNGPAVTGTRGPTLIS